MTTSETAFREFREKLSRFVAKRLNDPDDVEDVLQEVFLRVVRNEKSLKQARTPLAWLYTVTRSALIDHYRKKSRIPSAMTIDNALDDLAAPIEQPDQEFDKCLSPLVGNLPIKYREAIKFTDLEGGRQTEFARTKEISSSTAKSRVQRGRKMLKQAILSCCQVELDNKYNVIDLLPDDFNQDDCC